ncbi:MAG: T9SS type A sorting domain-containing protein [candidate division Zixibacteria bacterium]|nr:T9SS type A sorting domain-containing protein [candidate division Zixibacteria bacterium]
MKIICNYFDTSPIYPLCSGGIMIRNVILLFAVVSLLVCPLNAFADETKDANENKMTIEERIELGGLIIPDEVKERFKKLNQQPEPELLNTEEVFDWRQMGGVTPVKDQANCGSCWDFAAVGSFESAVLIADGIEWDLSEQQGLVCNTYGYGCDGGWMEAVYELFMSYGAVEESCMPYEADDTVPCYQDSCVVVVYQDDYIDIPNNVNSIKNALLTGPVATTFTVHGGFHWDCYENVYNGSNHAVVIVGFDDELCGDGGWIVKNSWGTGWGDDGYFYMPYNSCGIGYYTQLPVYSGGLRPELTYSPDSIIINVPAGGQGNDILALGNIGEGDLLFRLNVATPANQDSFGYFWYDSDSPEGPEYNWIDITGIGDVVNFPGDIDDGNSGPIDLGFDFNYYGNTFNSICVCTNGWASFTDDTSVEWGNQPIPHPEPPNNMIAPFYDDMNLENGGNVYFYSNDTDTAVIAWVDVPDWRQEGIFTFEIVLVAPDKIFFEYNSMGPGRLDEASIGIENGAGTVGLEIAYNEEYTTGQKAVEFTLGEALDWLSTDITSGTIEPNAAEDIIVTCSAGGHPEGTYRAVLELSTNDPQNLYTDIPVIMNIGETEMVSIDMIPDNPPVTVPAGGSFTYTGILSNNTGEYMRGDVWIMLNVPGVGMYGPLQLIRAVPLAPNQTITVPGIRQNVPTYAPQGTYDYISYCGLYPYMALDSASFEFTVTTPMISGAEDWNTSPWLNRETDGQLPEVFFVEQAYPNPFNATTTISYGLPAASDVNLSIYNIMGQKVETLVDGHQTAGYKTVRWDASEYSSGIYFYKVVAGDQVINKRMTLLK